VPRITLTAHDGFELAAWREPPREARRGGLIICHAIWGVTPHILSLAGAFADEGYEVIVPSLLDRYDPHGGFPAADTDPELYPERERAAVASGWGGACCLDIQSVINALEPPVFILGFCFGGTAAWVAACRCDGIAATSAFYGGHIVAYGSETPRSPIMLHFAKADSLIAPDDVELIRSRHPDAPVYLYDAGHAFVAPSGYQADAARLALLRTRAFFHRASGAKEAGA